jgi:hypothetical protein
MAREYLAFELPPFRRSVWISDAARETWQPRFDRLAQVWREIEWRSAKAGIRPGAAVAVAAAELVDFSALCAGAGCAAMPVLALPEGAERPTAFQVVVGSVELCDEFQRARRADDDRTMGRLLGYPACCVDAYVRWMEEYPGRDPLWTVASSTVAPDPLTRTIGISGQGTIDLLLHDLNVRTVPHVPCRFDCSKSQALAADLMDVGTREGFGDEMAWLAELKSWPVEWSALHGIAELRTPLVKVATRTDATPHKWTIQYEGRAYPADGARGLLFPYNLHP